MNLMMRGATSEQNRQHGGPIRVGDVMTKSVITLSSNDTISKAVDLMATDDFRHLIIADDEQKVVGVISDRDILSVKGRISEWRVKKILQIMTPKPFTVTPETELSVAVSMMIAKKN